MDELMLGNLIIKEKQIYIWEMFRNVFLTIGDDHIVALVVLKSF